MRLIVRVMRVLTTANFVQEAGEESYVASPATKAMTVPAMEAAVKHTSVCTVQKRFHSVPE